MKDNYGDYECLLIRGVEQRMRWIPPGKFLMGSPEDEPDRYSDETQHEVTLTKGFWLADTACTQALWSAVTGTNPSHFKGAEHPVEQVNWDDCKDFLDTVNAEQPGLDLSLPTEAQWEYACRAQTTTPFSFGETITPELVNYDGNYPYSGGRKGEYRKHTVDVGSLRCNAWGLFEMHGNVWEWCADWYGDYPTHPANDPIGPDIGTYHVMRGGSWFDNARCLRSAYRHVGPPSGRFDYFGFRIASN